MSVHVEPSLVFLLSLVSFACTDVSVAIHNFRFLPGRRCSVEPSFHSDPTPIHGEVPSCTPPPTTPNPQGLHDDELASGPLTDRGSVSTPLSFPSSLRASSSASPEDGRLPSPDLGYLRHPITVNQQCAEVRHQSEDGVRRKQICSWRLT
jgi:hypothetical protein